MITTPAPAVKFRFGIKTGGAACRARENSDPWNRIQPNRVTAEPAGTGNVFPARSSGFWYLVSEL